jgi:hypothetical protein
MRVIFSEFGWLSVGVHPMSLVDCEIYFCFNDVRKMLFEKLKTVLDELTTLDVDVFLDGSFIGQKPIPSDIDVIIRAREASGDIAVFNYLSDNRDKLKRQYSIDVMQDAYGSDAYVLTLQQVGEKQHVYSNAPANSTKGIVQIT